MSRVGGSARLLRTVVIPAGCFSVGARLPVMCIQCVLARVCFSANLGVVRMFPTLFRDVLVDLLRRGGLRVLRGDSAPLRFLGASGDRTDRLRLWGFDRWRERLRDDEDEDRRR